jgi:4'-phosphopantetheinyl transferase
VGPCLELVLLDVGALRAAPPVERLAADERARLARIFRPHEAAAFVVGRILLRQRLQAWLGHASVESGPNGRPRAVGGGVSFSLAASGRWTALAIGRVAVLGLDVQAADGRRHAPSPLVFGARERRSYARAGAGEAAFLVGWTRKEAVLKALGVGLAQPWRAEVDFRADAPHPILSVNGRGTSARAWTLRDLSLPDGTAAALVTA